MYHADNLINATESMRPYVMRTFSVRCALAALTSARNQALFHTRYLVYLVHFPRIVQIRIYPNIYHLDPNLDPHLSLGYVVKESV